MFTKHDLRQAFSKKSVTGFLRKGLRVAGYTYLGAVGLSTGASLAGFALQAGERPLPMYTRSYAPLQRDRTSVLDEDSYDWWN